MVDLDPLTINLDPSPSIRVAHGELSE